MSAKETYNGNTRQNLGIEDYRGVLDNLLRLLRKRTGSRFLAAALFGSVARGAANPLSDIDLLVVYTGSKREIHRIFIDIILEMRKSEIYRELEKKGILAEVYPIFIGRQKLEDTPWILLDVMDHGIILYDPQKILLVKLSSLRQRLNELGARKIELDDSSWYWDLKPDWQTGEVFEI